MESDYNELKRLFKMHIIKIVFLLILIVFLTYILNYLNIIKNSKNEYMKENLETIKNFKGFDMSFDIMENMSQMEFKPLEYGKNNNFLLFGSSDSGKTFFLKRWIDAHGINKSDIYACGDSLEEWEGTVDNDNAITMNVLLDLWDTYIEEKKSKTKDELHEYMKNSKLYKKIIIFDDSGGAQKNHKDKIGKIFSEIRHLKSLIIFVCHSPADVSPKTRENIRLMYVTTENPITLFEKLKDSLKLSNNLSQFSKIKKGIIKYNLITEEYDVYDSNLYLVNSSFRNIVNNTSDFDIFRFIDMYYFNEEDRNNIRIFLEKKALNDIDINPEFTTYYLYYYYIQAGKKVNIAKLRHLISIYKSKWSVGLENAFKEAERFVPYLNSIDRFVSK